MARFNEKDLVHRGDFKYIQNFINDIKSKKELTIEICKTESCKEKDPKKTITIKYDDNKEIINKIQQIFKYYKEKSNNNLAKYEKEIEKELLSILKIKSNWKPVFKDTEGNLYKWSDIYKGQYSQSKRTKTTQINEEIQIIGLLIQNISDNDQKLLKEIEKFIDKKGDKLKNIKTIKEFLKNPDNEEFDKNRILNVIRQAYSIRNELFKKYLKVDNIDKIGYIHNQINDYYKKIKKLEKLNLNIEKENTADVVFYDNSYGDLLTAIDKATDIDYQQFKNKQYNIILKDENENIIGNFIQISLKEGGRLGKSKEMKKEFNKIHDKKINDYNISKENYYDIFDNEFDYIMESILSDKWKSFKEFFKSKYQSFKIYISDKIIKKIQQIKDYFYKKLNLNKGTDKLDKILQNKAKELLKDLLNESIIYEKSYSFIDDVYFIKYTNEEFFNKLKNDISKGLNKLESILKSKKILFNIDKKTIKKISFKYIEKLNEGYKNIFRLFYNAAAIETLIEIFNKFTINDLKYLEYEIIYGKTSLPLIKVDISESKAKIIPLKYNSNIDIKKLKYPFIFVEIKKSQNTKEKDLIYYAINIYIYKMSENNPENPEYMKIQARTAGSQFTFEGQTYVPYSQLKKRLKI